MKFSTILTFASLALASPMMDKRQQTAVGTVTDAVTTLQSTIAYNINQIQNTIKTVKDNVSASVAAQIESQITANYDAIIKAFKSATTNVVKATTGSASGVAGQVKNLAQDDVDELTRDINRIADALEGLQAGLELTATDLTPSIRQALQGEVDAVKGAVGPFASPLLMLASAIKTANVGGKFKVDGISAAQDNLSEVLSDAIKSIGLPTHPVRVS